MYLEIKIIGDETELGPVLAALQGIKVDGQTPVVVLSGEGGKKRRTKAEMAADEAAKAQGALLEPEKPIEVLGEPGTPAPVALPETPPAAPVVVTVKTYTDEELRAKAMPKIKELGQPKMQEVLQSFGIKSITEAGPAQRKVFMQKIDSYTKDSVAATHFVPLTAATVDEVATSADEFIF